MTLEKIEAGNRVGRGAGLGVEKACVDAAFDPENTHVELQAQRLARQYGLTSEHAQLVASLAYAVRPRR